MKKAYIVLIHKNPEQVYNLIKRLDDKQSDFFIHIDLKAPEHLFENLLDFGEKVNFTKRENGRWGGFGIVKATINALQKIKNINKNYDSIILISGQDYPLKSNEYIDNFLTASKEKIFLTTFSALPVAGWEQGGLNRINDYYLGLQKHHIYINKIVNTFKKFLPVLRKKIPYNLTVYAGSQWWIMDTYAANYVLNYIQSHKEILRFFKYSLLPDEMFFQTILLNSNDERILNSIKNDNKRLIIIPTGHIHPTTLKKDNLETLLTSDGLFARKFDTELDADIFGLLDENVI